MSTRPKQASNRLPIPAKVFVMLACVQCALLVCSLAVLPAVSAVRDFTIGFNSLFIGWDVAFAFWTVKVNEQRATLIAAEQVPPARA